jgi:hypothetical protein
MLLFLLFDILLVKPLKISAHADGGPRSRVCARETLLSAPHQRERKFFRARVCRVTFKHLPQPLTSHIQSFETIGQLLKFSKKNLKLPPQGARGGLQIFLEFNISFFCEKKPHVKFRNSNSPPSKFFPKNLKKP